MARLLSSLVLAFVGWLCVHLLLVMDGSGSTDFEAFAMAVAKQKPRGVVSEFVEMVKPGFGSVDNPTGDVTSNEKLPVSQFHRWPHWIVQRMDPSPRLKAIPSPISHPHLAEEGWVNPSGFDQVWLAEGLPPPEARIGISGIFKDGKLLYIAPALDLSVRAANRTWRNRGMNSVGLAKQWLYTNQAIKRGMKLTGHVQKGKSWVKILDDGLEIHDSVKKLLNNLLFQKSGYHVVTLPITGPVLQDELMLGHKEGFQMTLHLSQEDAGEDQEVPLLDEAILSVKVRTVESGSASENRPKAYEPLYASA